MAHFLFWPCEDCVGPGSSLGILGLVKFRSWVKFKVNFMSVVSAGFNHVSLSSQQFGLAPD
jgi:hypothetical protein